MQLASVLVKYCSMCSGRQCMKKGQHLLHSRHSPECCGIALKAK